MIRLGLAKAEVELEVVEPRDAGGDVFAFEDVGQVFVMFFEQVRVGCIVEGEEDGVIAGVRDIDVTLWTGSFFVASILTYVIR